MWSAGTKSHRHRALLGPPIPQAWKNRLESVLLSFNKDKKITHENVINNTTAFASPRPRRSVSHSVLHKALCFHGFPSQVL